MDPYHDFLSDSRSPIDVNAKGILKLRYEPITIFYDIERGEVISQPKLSKQLQDLIVKVISQTLSGINQPLPHLQKTLRFIYTHANNHDYAPPDADTGYKIQQVLHELDNPSNTLVEEQELEAILNHLLPGVFIIENNPYLDTNIYDLMSNYDIKDYPTSLIDMYYEVDNLLSEFSWDNPDAPLFGVVGVIPAYNYEQATLDNLWLSGNDL